MIISQLLLGKLTMKIKSGKTLRTIWHLFFILKKLNEKDVNKCPENSIWERKKPYL